MAKYFQARSVRSSGEYWDSGAAPLQEHWQFKSPAKKTNMTEPFLQTVAAHNTYWQSTGTILWQKEAQVRPETISWLINMSMI